MTEEENKQPPVRTMSREERDFYQGETIDESGSGERERSTRDSGIRITVNNRSLFSGKPMGKLLALAGGGIVLLILIFVVQPAMTVVGIGALIGVLIYYIRHKL